jgi:hypothetical protein
VEYAKGSQVADNQASVFTSLHVIVHMQGRKTLYDRTFCLGTQRKSPCFNGTKRGVERQYFAQIPVLNKWRYLRPRVGVVEYIWLVVCEL